MNEIESSIWRWIDNVVIAENFCPFAKFPRQQDQIRLHLCEQKSLKDILETVALECKYLDEHAKTETTLIVLTKALTNFDSYLDAYDLAQNLLDDLGYSGIYQLASFHPKYVFAGEPLSSASHFTNRAPLPIFHILREQSISLAVAKIDDPESIPQRNIEHAENLGVDFFERHLSKTSK